MKKMNNIINKFGEAFAINIHTATTVPHNGINNLCLGIWGYEEDMPDELKDKC